MPEYLAPGVYVEEVSFRSKSIEGVSTTTTGFIGPTRYGPVDLDSEVITSLRDFARMFGDGEQLDQESSSFHNYMWHAARAFFTEGGQRLYVSRTFRRLDAENDPPPTDVVDTTNPPQTNNLYNDGHARIRVPASGGSDNDALFIRARWPGAAGNLRVRFNLILGSSVLRFDRAPSGTIARLGAVGHRDVVVITRGSPVERDVYMAELNELAGTWTFTPRSGAGSPFNLDDGTLAEGDQVQVVRVLVTVEPTDTLPMECALDPLHRTNGANDSLFWVFGSQVETPLLIDNPNHGRDWPVVISGGTAVDTGLEVLEALFAAGELDSPAGVDEVSLEDMLLGDQAAEFGDTARAIEVLLVGGNDGLRPTALEYEGAAEASSTKKTGLKQFEDLDDVSIVAAPGSTFNFESGGQDEANTIINLLIAHCQYMKYRIAVIDSGNAQSVSQVRDMRARFDTSYAAMYYPWVRILDPITQAPIFLPPSGFVAGIYARNDINRAVFKAPANEVVNLSIGFEQLLNKAQQDVLNPQGVNCFRFFEGRGYRLWGGRTMSSDPEWKYVNLRRYFAYLEHSIDNGTQWAVFEPNGPQLWSNIRQTIEDFLVNEFMNGALLGDKADKAFFVRCDRSTMTQNDLDNGRLVCLIGVAVVKPAEYVIFRIGQWTADRR